MGFALENSKVAMRNNEQTFSNDSIAKIADILEPNNIKLLNQKVDIFGVVRGFLQNSNSEDPEESEEPFFVVNLGSVIRQYEQWVRYLPNIRPYYAIKCNPDLLIIKTLQRLGCGFDCASNNEVTKALEMGASPDELIYANPCKTPSMIKFARSQNVKRFTCDSELDLQKLKTHYPDSDIVVRIATDDHASNIHLSDKFGCTLEEAEQLLQLAKDLSLNIKGVSFHVGCGSTDPKAFPNAIQNAKKVFEFGKSLGFEMNFLDIGGGYPGTDTDQITFEGIARSINQGLEDHFKDILLLKSYQNQAAISSSNLIPW